MQPSEYRIEPHPSFGFSRVLPTPSAEVIARFYAEHFYSGEYQRFNNSSLEVQERDRAFNDGHREDIWAAVSRCAGRPLDGCRLLDIGCGYAQSLEFFRDKGMSCYGFDPAPEAVEHARRQGLEVVQAGLERMDVFSGLRFDVATMFHVLEHLADPVGVLSEIREKVLTPGGFLVLEVPNDFNALQRAACELHGLEQWWVAPPGHLNYFSGETLLRLLVGCGYRPLHTEATFPLEVFLLFGDNYVKDREVGRACHARRVAFEQNLRRLGPDTLRGFYRSLAEQNLGRTVVAIAQCC